MGYIDDMPVENGRFAGSTLDRLTPFALFTGLGLVATISAT